MKPLDVAMLLAVSTWGAFWTGLFLGLRYRRRLRVVSSRAPH